MTSLMELIKSLSKRSFTIEKIRQRRNKHARMMQAFNKYQCVFIHIDKTAGNSINAFLGIQDRTHWGWKAYRRRLGIRKFNTYLKFAVVRNPWDRVVSNYEYWTRTNKLGITDDGISFRDWVIRTFETRESQYAFELKRWIRPCASWITKNDGTLVVDEILRFESLEQDFHRLCERAGWNFQELRHLNRSPARKHYHEYYDDDTRDAIAHYYVADVAMFDYKF